MLLHRKLSPKWTELKSWPEISPATLEMLRHVARQAGIFHLGGDGLNEAFVFRHDRVRERLFVHAIASDLSSGKVDESVLGEPYFAEFIGTALAETLVTQQIVESIRSANPLALFHALRAFKEPANDTHRAVIAALNLWLTDEATHAVGNNQLRWAALQALSQTESSHVCGMVARFRDRHWAGFRARFRNGDLAGGIELCRQLEPGVRMIGHEELIQHVYGKYGSAAIRGLDKFLRRKDIPQGARVGALRLAGHFADPARARRWRYRKRQTF